MSDTRLMQARSRLSWEGDFKFPADAELPHPLPTPGYLPVEEAGPGSVYDRAFVTLGLRPGTHATFRVTLERLSGVELSGEQEDDGGDGGEVGE